MKIPNVGKGAPNPGTPSHFYDTKSKTYDLQAIYPRAKFKIQCKHLAT